MKADRRMKCFVTRQNHVIGIFWCGATRAFSLNPTEGFGLRINFRFSEAQETKQNEALLDMLSEKRRVGALTNRELVTEALHANDTDTPLINEMMDRLDPGWYEHDES